MWLPRARSDLTNDSPAVLSLLLTSPLVLLHTRYESTAPMALFCMFLWRKWKHHQASRMRDLQGDARQPLRTR